MTSQTKQEIKRLAIRAFVTFLQTALAFWVVADKTDWKIALAGAVGAGASVVYNTVIQPYLAERTRGV